jgi:hypothetical protein
VRRITFKPRRVLVLVAALCVAAAAPALGASPAQHKLPGGAAAGYAGTHFGDGNIPAGCIIDKDQDDPDNKCFHMRVGLNALDSPEVNVAVLVPVSPFALRDASLMRQAVQMWDGGIHMLANQMNLQWLSKGVHFHITTDLVPVDKDGLPKEAIRLVSPKIIVIATNPAGGLGIGIDPVATVGELGVIGQNGVPCGSFTNPFSMKHWLTVPGFDDHHGELGGIYVHRCDGPGGNVCFSINGAVDPLPGKTDFFSIYDLVAHETGHCLTLGHVGDGADGPWGPIPTNDIMAYSSDPVDLAKCVSTLDVEGFALRMSNFLDVNGDGKVDGRDVLVPNDKKGDGTNSFQVQNPADHGYASSTGRAEDCPQPAWNSLLPVGTPVDFQPSTVRTTTPELSINSVKSKGGRVAWGGTASWVSSTPNPATRSTSVTDATGDGTLPMTDITGFHAWTTPKAVMATVKIAKLWPTVEGGRVTGYGLYVGGRKFDSYVQTQSTNFGQVQTIDSGNRLVMPAGTSKWDTKNSTITFRIPRSYLAEQRIQAPYPVFAETGVHIRDKDWVMSLDRAPATGSIALAAAPMAHQRLDVPMAHKAATRTFEVQHVGGNTFTPLDTSTSGLPLVPEVGNVHEIRVPIKKQSTVTVTLTWTDPVSELGLQVKGGSGQEVKTGVGSVTVTVPWAHRDLTARVIPSVVGSPSVHYTVTVKTKTLTANADGDGVPDIADLCKHVKGPMNADGCPDTDRDGILDNQDKCPKVAGLGAFGCPNSTDDRVVAYLDGKRVSTTYVMTLHGNYDFAGSATARPGRHLLRLVWLSGTTPVKSITRSVTV